jgi:hypothetical protein
MNISWGCDAGHYSVTIWCTNCGKIVSSYPNAPDELIPDVFWEDHYCSDECKLKSMLKRFE